MSCMLNAAIIIVASFISLHNQQSTSNANTATTTATGKLTSPTDATEIGEEYEDDQNILRFIQLKSSNEPLMDVVGSYEWQPKSPAEWNFDEEGGMRFTTEGGKVQYDIIIAGVPVTLVVNAENVRDHAELYEVQDSQVYDISCMLEASFPYDSIHNNHWMLRLNMKDKDGNPSSKRFPFFRKQIPSNAPVLLNKTWKLKYTESLHRSMLICSLYSSTMKLNKTTTKGAFSDVKVIMTKYKGLDQAYMNNVRIGIILALAISMLLSMLSGLLYRMQREKEQDSVGNGPNPHTRPRVVVPPPIINLDNSSVDTEHKEVGSNQTTHDRSTLATSASTRQTTISSSSSTSTKYN